jgi:hypothetical protein
LTTTGTPNVQLAVASVAEITVTLSAETPPKVALAEYPVVGKPVPVKVIVDGLDIATAEIIGIDD